MPRRFAASCFTCNGAALRLGVRALSDGFRVAAYVAALAAPALFALA